MSPSLDFRTAAMSRFQVMAVVIALVLIFIDGFDVAVMAYAAPSLSREWGIDPVMLGYLLSASLFGMAAGSIFLTPMADVIGRRKLTLASLVVISIGMTLSVFAPNEYVLLAWRVLTGLGVGGMMANLNVLVSEYSSDLRRGFHHGHLCGRLPYRRDHRRHGSRTDDPGLRVALSLRGRRRTDRDHVAGLLALPARIPGFPGH